MKKPIPTDRYFDLYAARVRQAERGALLAEDVGAHATAAFRVLALGEIDERKASELRGHMAEIECAARRIAATLREDGE